MPSYSTLPSGKIRAQIFANGKRMSRSFRTKREASAWAESTSLSIKLADQERIFLVTRHGKSARTDIVSPETILDSLTPIYAAHGIYILFNSGVCVYVGKSKNVLSRICSHAEKGRSFTHYYIIPCLESELAKTEADYISMFLPAKNKDGI